MDSSSDGEIEFYAIWSLINYIVKRMLPVLEGGQNGIYLRSQKCVYKKYCVKIILKLLLAL